MAEATAIKILEALRKAKLRDEKERAIWEKCYEYVNNRVGGELGQWAEEDRGQLREVGKPTISFNEIKKFVNRICGAQRQTKVDEKAFPKDDVADVSTSDIITDLLKYVRDVNDAENHYNRMFRDGVITSRGWMKVEWSDELDILGEITLKSVNPKNIYIVGSGEAYDLMDRLGLLEVLPMTKEEIIALFPEKEDEIEEMAKDPEKETEIPVSEGDDYAFGGSIPLEDVYDKEEQKFNVLRYQKFEYRDIKFLQNGMNGQLKEIELNKKQAKEAANLISMQTGVPHTLINKRVRRVRVYYSVGNVLLSEEWSKYKHNKFDLVGYFPYVDDGTTTGVVQDLLDPQDEKNKRHSQIIHILGTAARSSFVTSKGVFDDIEQTRKDLSRIGFVHEANVPIGQINQAIVPIQNDLTPIPAIIQMDITATSEMKEISGISDAGLGVVPSGVKSGRGINELQQPVEMIIGEIFDNYLISRKAIARLIVALIQQYYTSERKIRILGEFNPAIADERTKMMMGNGLVSMDEGQKMVTINKDSGDGVLNDVTVGKYDIVIEHIPSHPTMRRARYFEMLNMKSMGAPVKWSTIIKNSDVPNKNELLRDALEAEQAMAILGAMPQMGQGAQGGSLPAMPEDQGINLSGAQ